MERDQSSRGVFGASQGSQAEGLAGTGTDDFLISSRLRSLILEKEKELADINQFRIDSLEQMLRDRDRIIAELTEKMKKLKDDFHYNLSLIEERDAELERYDGTFASLKEGLREKDREISEHKITISELEAKIKLQASRHADTEASFQTKLKEVQDELGLNNAAHDEDIRRRRVEFEALRYGMERQLGEKDEELAAQRREITVGFEEVMRQRETETRAREEELMAQLRHLEREVAHKNRSLEKAEAQERLIHEQSAKMSLLIQEKQDLQSQIARLTADHEDKMNELLETLHAVEKAFVVHKSDNEQERARLEMTHEEKLRTAIVKRDSKIDSLKEALGQAEDRAQQLEAALQEVKRDLEDKLSMKARQVDAQEQHYTAELENKESAVLSLKNQLWNTEAELKQAQAKISDLAALCDDRARDVVRLRDQTNQLREALEQVNRESLGRIEEMRKELESRGAHQKTVQQEALALASAQAESAQADADALRSKVIAMEGELLRRQEKIDDLQDEMAHMERQITMLKAAAEAQDRMAAARASSPVFSEDMGPASPLHGGRRAGDIGGGGGLRPGMRYDHEQWNPGGHDRALAAAEKDELQHENRRLRVVITEMRHEMESLRASIATAPPAHDASLAAVRHHTDATVSGTTLTTELPSPGGLGQAATGKESSREGLGGNGGGGVDEEEMKRRREAEEKADALAQENKQLREDNKRLMGTCDKLMEISNELNSRFNKLTSSIGSGSRSRPLAFGDASAEQHLPPAISPGRPTLAGMRPDLDGSTAAAAMDGRRAPHSLTSEPFDSVPLTSELPPPPSVPRSRAEVQVPEFRSRQKLERARDEMLLTGGGLMRMTAAPPTPPVAARASDRQTKGQKQAAQKLRAQVEHKKTSSRAAAGGAGGARAPSRQEMLQQRQKMVRNWNVKDDLS